MPVISHSRRRFLERIALVAGGAATGLILPKLWTAEGFSTPARADEGQGTPVPSPEERIKQLGLKLPEVAAPVATYVPAVLAGDMLYVSGHGPRDEEGRQITGKVGKDVDLDGGRAAAERVGLIVLSTVRNLLGSLDRVQRVVKTLGMVNCTDDFTQQSQVINGFSDLMVQVFGPERGTGARSAVGMNALPGNIVVEIEVIFQART